MLGETTSLSWRPVGKSTNSALSQPGTLFLRISGFNNASNTCARGAFTLWLLEKSMCALNLFCYYVLLGKVQMNVTVSQLSSQRQSRLRINQGYRRIDSPVRRIAQGYQPIGAGFGHATSHERTLPTMQAPLGDAMIVPDGQQRHHPARQAAQHRQVRTQHTVPILDGTAGPHRCLPRGQQGGSDGSPVGGHTVQQLLGGRAQDGASLPRPAPQMQSAWPQGLASLVLQRIQSWRK